MAQDALYLKWRPKDFDDVVGQTHVTRTLRNACRSGHVAHAYLFAGPRGTGKTSNARILAKALNCLAEPEARPCNECRICVAINEGRFLDLIEIDGASNRGIDEIRDLREKVNFRPNEGGYKVYIIDEVHMLTREAFNALLKTLEEPPEHVIFVFATTEVWRVPATIRSRCQRFDLRPLSLELIEGRLLEICEKEGIGRDDQALALIARQATGSMRDAISMLDQIASIGEGMVTAEMVRSVLGTAPDEAAEELVHYLIQQDTAAALELLNKLAAEGYDMRQFALDALTVARSMLLLRLRVRPETEVPREDLVRLHDLAGKLEVGDLLKMANAFASATAEVRHGLLPQLPLELAVVEIGDHLASRSDIKAAPPTAEQDRRAPQPRQESAPPISSAPSPSPDRFSAPPEIDRSVAGTPPLEVGRSGGEPMTLGRLRKLWPKVAAKVHRRDRMLEAMLRSTEPVALENGVVRIAFAYPYHHSCFSGEQERRILLEALAEVCSEPLQAEFVVVVPGSGMEKSNSGETAPGHESESNGRSQDLEEDPLLRAARDLGGEVSIVDSGGEE